MSTGYYEEDSYWSSQSDLDAWEEEQVFRDREYDPYLDEESLGYIEDDEFDDDDDIIDDDDDYIDDYIDDDIYYENPYP